MTMGSIRARAVWFESQCVAALREEEAPTPGAEEIRVRALHSLISAGSEMTLYRGEGNLPSLLLPTCAGELPFPFKFGYQVVGEVETAGERSGYKAGELVFVQHPHQDLFTLSTTIGMVLRLPADMDPLRAAFIEQAKVALQTHLEAPVRIGECVAVSGLGVIGCLAAHLARRTAGRLIIIDPIKARREGAAWVGADACIEPEAVPEVVSEMTDGRGVDMFIETSGASPALQMAIVNTGSRGTIVAPAWYGSRPVTLLLSPEFMLKALEIKSVFVGSVGGDEAHRWDEDRRMATVLDILETIEPDNLFTQRISFEDASEAYRLLDERPAEARGVILDY